MGNESRLDSEGGDAFMTELDRRERRAVEIEKDLAKIFNNLEVEADYFLFAKYGITNGKEEFRSYAYERLQKLGIKNQREWICPF